MNEVFISYARESADFASRVSAALKAVGHSVWMDDRIPAHREYADEISERLDEAKAVLVIWSDAGTKSQWVRSEATRGRESGKLVQLRIDGARLPMPFDQIQCADLHAWSGDAAEPHWQQVLASIDALTGRGPQTPTVATVPHKDIPSVAILPFKDLSPAKDQGYFCEGVAEEILMTLAKLPGLRVASPGALAEGATATAAHRLGVTAILEGSIRKAADRARIAVRLIESRSDFTIWAETFDRDLGDVFALQDEIARAVVSALGLTLLPSEVKSIGVGGSDNAAAYDLYLKGKALVRRELETERRRAAELFREAARRDPEFALAYAGLAEVLVDIARQHPDDWSSAADEAQRSARKAVELEPGLAEAHLALGAALRLNHDPDAAREYEKAVELNPHDANVHYRFARFLVIEGEKRRAIEHYDKAFALAPDDYRYSVYTLQEYQALGDKEGERRSLERAWPAVEQHLKVNPDDVRAMGHGAGMLAIMGRAEDCRKFIDRALVLRPDDFGNLVNLACAAMLNGEPERALDLLERGVASGRGDKEWLVEDNDLKPLHGHPRFEAILAKMS